MNRQTAVLFDLDGTLVDTLQDLALTTNAVLEQHGYPTHPLDAYRHFVGSGAKVLIERALFPVQDPALAEVLYREFLARYDTTCLEHVCPYEGIPALLRQLQEAGAALAVITNKPEPQARRIVSHLFREIRFYAVYGGRSGRPKKPDPTAVWQALREKNIAPGRALFVGDSDVDMETARRAGMPGIGAVWGFRGEAELRNSGASFLARQPADIFTIFSRIERE